MWRLPASVLVLLLVIGCNLWLDPQPAWAADLQVAEVHLEPCPSDDPGAQPDRRGYSGASCYALRGRVDNPGKQTVVDADLFAVILDASGEPVLQNRTRVGSIGDVPPGRTDFAVRLAVPRGTPEPLIVRNVKARGFRAPVRARVSAGDELLPLEQQLS
ncbi:MAG: hypothetical protein VKK98_10000 [Cyanobacteriota bacterium]|nr:hypothetical protein [Cyanobacteriota bacterium]